MRATLFDQVRVRGRSALRTALQWSGVAAAFEAVSRPDGAIVLMYHSVARDEVADFIDPSNRVPSDLFERQMAFLAGQRTVVPLSAALDAIAAGRTLRAGTVCITFDDGYLDNLTVAAPILAKYRLPATLFLATGYVERAESQWADELHRMFRARSADQLCLPSLGGEVLQLATAAGRRAAYRIIHPRLLEATRAERSSLLADIEQAVAPTGPRPRLTMNWDEARELCRRFPLFEIGGHTREHIDLSTHRAGLARAEIDACAADLRRELGIEPRHFSFPYGRWCEGSRQLVRASGWQSAVGANQRIRLDGYSDRFAIGRVEAPRTMTELRFVTGGAHPGLLSMLGVAGKGAAVSPLRMRA
jgi:peptidoglycan/xylan/chitin deacetylase (PgdA/CDA1 family)